MHLVSTDIDLQHHATCHLKYLLTRTAFITRRRLPPIENKFAAFNQVTCVFYTYVRVTVISRTVLAISYNKGRVREAA